MSEPQFQEIWEQTLRHFHATTERRLDDQSMPKPETISSLQNEVDKWQQDFAKYRERRKRLFELMSAAFRPVELLGEFAAGAASLAFPPSTLVFGAVAYMIGTAKNVSASYDAICDLFSLITGFTTRLKVYMRQDVPLELQRVVAEIFCCLIRVCGYTARLIKHGRAREYLKRFLIGEDREVASELDKLKQLLLDEERLVAALSFQLVSNVNGNMQVIHDQVNFIAEAITSASAAQKNEAAIKQMDRIRLALEPKMASEEIYRSITKGRLEGTGNWVRDEPLLSEWLEGKEPVLWISGGPGAGKSYLASNIIEMLTKKQSQDNIQSSSTSVAYFFCKDSDPDLRSLHVALKSIAYQLCEQDATFARHVFTVCSYPENIKSTASTWRTLFLDFFCKQKLISLAYVLIDGIDETTDVARELFFEQLRDLRDLHKVGTKAQLRVLQIGRYEISHEMNRVFDEPVPMIAITARKNSGDIQQYVKIRIAKEQSLRRIPADLRDDIRDTLVHKADGMFLWVNLMLKEISRKSRPAHMRQALLHMPKGLYEAMRQTFERLSQELDDQEATDLCMMLSWVTCAMRPLTLSELDDVLKLTSEDGDGVVYLEGLLRNQYASFFAVHREDGRTTGELQMEHLLLKAQNRSVEGTTDIQSSTLAPLSGDNSDFEDAGIDSDPAKTEISLAHNSFASFFRDEQMSGKVKVDINQAHVSIVKILLGMICDGRTLRKYITRTISAYAAEHWQDHLRSIDLKAVRQHDIDGISQYLLRLFRVRLTALSWAQRNRFLRNDWFCKEDNNTAVHAWLLAANLEPAQKGWVERLYPKSSAEVTDDLITESASRWLQGHMGAAKLFFLRIKAHHQMVLARREGQPLPCLGLYDNVDLDVSNNSAATVVEIAKSFEFQEDDIWHLRVAQVLRWAEHYEDALIHFKESANYGSSSWRADFGMAHVYRLMDQPTTAIKAVQDCLSALDSDPVQKAEAGKDLYDNALRLLGSLQAKVNDNDGCTQAFQKVFNNNPRDYSAATRLVGLLLFKGQSNKAMQIYREAQQDILQSADISRLDDWVMTLTWSPQKRTPQNEFYEVLVTVCRELGKMDFAIGTYVSAIKAAVKTGSGVKSLLQNDHAEILIREVGRQGEAAVLLEGIMDSTRKSRPATPSYFARQKVCELICDLQTARAVEAGNDSPAAVQAISKLVSLSATQSLGLKQSKSIPTSITQVPSGTYQYTLALGILYRFVGHETEARELFRELIKLALALLSDDDPSNDFIAYEKLGQVLLKAGDDAGAIAARVWLGARPNIQTKRSSISGALSRITSAESNDDTLSELKRQETIPLRRSNTVSPEASDNQQMTSPVVGPRKSAITTLIIPTTKLADRTVQLMSPVVGPGDYTDPTLVASTVKAADRASPYYWSCDGRVCNQREIHQTDGLYSCRFCLNVDFEEDCYKLLMQDKLPFNMCSKKHVFLHHPVLTEPVPQGMMYVQGKYVTEQAWLKKLKEDWSLQ